MNFLSLRPVSFRRIMKANMPVFHVPGPAGLTHLYVGPYIRVRRLGDTKHAHLATNQL